MSRNSSEYQGAWGGGLASAGGPHSAPLYSDGSQQFSQGPAYPSLGSSANAFCAAGDGLMVQRGASWTAGQTGYQSPLSSLQQMQLGLGPRPELGLPGDGTNFVAAQQQQQQQQWLAMAGAQVSSLGSSPPSHSLQQQLAGPVAFGGAAAAPAAGRPISSKNPFAAMPRALRNNQLRNNLLAAAGSFTDMASGGGGSSSRASGGLAPPPPPIRHSSLPVDPAATAAAVAAAQRLLSAEQEQQHNAGAMAPPPPPPPPPPPQQPQQGATQQRHAATGAQLSGIEEEPAAPEAEETPAADSRAATQPADRTAASPAASPEASGGSWSSGTRPGSGYSSLCAAASGRGDAPAAADGAWRPSRRSLTGDQPDAALQYLQQQQAAAAAAQRLAGLGLGSRRRESPAASGRDSDGLCAVERSVFSDPLLYGARPSADSQQRPTDVAQLPDQQLGHHHAGLPAVPVPRSVSDPTVLMVAHSGLSFTSARAKGANKGPGGFFGQPAAPASGGGVVPAEVAEHVQLLLQRQQALQAMQQEVQEQLLQLLPHSGGADQH